MSGTVVSNVFRTSGVIAATAAGINFQSSVVTGTTLSVAAGNGYFIDTTSNICTVTLPSSAAAGDQIVLVDYARTWGTYKIVIDSNGLNFQGQDDTYVVEYNTSGVTVNIVYSGSSKGWTPISDDVVTDAPVAPPTQKGIFAYGTTGTNSNTRNLVNSSGVVAADATGAGSARNGTAGAPYGGDKGIYAYGTANSGKTAVSNLVTAAGVVSNDVSAVGTPKTAMAAAGYGADLALFAYGSDASAYTNTKNLVNNVGVVASDATGGGTARVNLAAARFGDGQAIFAFGYLTGAPNTNLSNKVSNTGVIASDTSGVGTARRQLTAASFGTDTAIFLMGSGPTDKTNKVSNTGVVASDVSGVGTARSGPAALNYGGDKAIMAYGYSDPNYLNTRNLINSSGVLASDSSGAGTARYLCPGIGISTSA